MPKLVDEVGWIVLHDDDNEIGGMPAAAAVRLCDGQFVIAFGVLDRLGFVRIGEWRPEDLPILRRLADFAHQWKDGGYSDDICQSYIMDIGREGWKIRHGHFVPNENRHV